MTLAGYIALDIAIDPPREDLFFHNMDGEHAVINNNFSQFEPATHARVRAATASP